jgi:hypothetical protein
MRRSTESTVGGNWCPNVPPRSRRRPWRTRAPQRGCVSEKGDGFGLVAGIRADEHSRSLPVILLSARAGTVRGRTFATQIDVRHRPTSASPGNAFESVLPKPVIQLRAGNAQLARRHRFVSVNLPHGSLNRLALDDVQVCAVYHHWSYGGREA